MARINRLKLSECIANNYCILYNWQLLVSYRKSIIYVYSIKIIPL